MQTDYSRTCAGFDERLASVLAAAMNHDATAGDGLRKYTLFPVARMIDLYGEIAADDGTGARIAAFFAQPGRADEFWAGATAAPSLVPSRAAVAAMKEWTRTTTPLRDVWLHEAYQLPNNDFREWLFNRAGLGLSTKAEAGNWVTGFSLRLSEIRLPKKILFLLPLPGGVGGSQAFHDSRVEAYAHFDGVANDETACGAGRLCLYDAGIDFFSGRGRFGGSYVGLTWNEEYNARRWYQHIGLGAGVEIGLPSVALKPWTRPASVMLMAGLSAQLFRPRVGDVTGDAPSREISGIRALVGLRVTYGFWHPRHPLSY
jgi:hypothetical protein